MASNSLEMNVYVALEEGAYLYDPSRHRKLAQGSQPMC